MSCKSAQAVGGALKRNSFAPVVPCHRVISSDLKIGGEEMSVQIFSTFWFTNSSSGFCGHTSGTEIDRKIAMLKEEGVEFEDGVLKDSSKVWKFSWTVCILVVVEIIKRRIKLTLQKSLFQTVEDLSAQTWIEITDYLSTRKVILFWMGGKILSLQFTVAQKKTFGNRTCHSNTSLHVENKSETMIPLCDRFCFI